MERHVSRNFYKLSLVSFQMRTLSLTVFSDLFETRVVCSDHDLACQLIPAPAA
jgi:hypothetical protein